MEEISRETLVMASNIIGRESAGSKAIEDADAFLVKHPSGKVRFFRDGHTIIVEKKEK